MALRQIRLSIRYPKAQKAWPTQGTQSDSAAAFLEETPSSPLPFQQFSIRVQHHPVGRGVARDRDVRS